MWQFTGLVAPNGPNYCLNTLLVKHGSHTSFRSETSRAGLKCTDFSLSLKQEEGLHIENIVHFSFAISRAVSPQRNCASVVVCLVRYFPPSKSKALSTVFASMHQCERRITSGFLCHSVRTPLGKRNDHIPIFVVGA